jgi:HEPN domain-containing protein
MTPREETKRGLVVRWLAMADEDLSAAEVLLGQKKPFLFAAGFHAQQAAEKSLKAFLTWHQVEFPKTHDLGVLLDLAARAAPDLEQELRDTVALNPYGVQERYPGEGTPMSVEEARQAVVLARKARAAVGRALEGRV